LVEPKIILTFVLQLHIINNGRVKTYVSFHPKKVTHTNTPNRIWVRGKTLVPI